jgi:PQQ-dependent dehydrogenase (methanol/ethanol family)
MRDSTSARLKGAAETHANDVSTVACDRAAPSNNARATRFAAACVLACCAFVADAQAVDGGSPASAAVADASSGADGGTDWPQAPHDFANTRYAPLAQITPGNVAGLRLAFSWFTGIKRGHEEAPVVAGDTMYLVGPWPNSLVAFDLTKPGANIKWRFEPGPQPFAQGVACCDIVNRGAAFADGRVFINTLDAQTVAVDAATGKEIWRRKLGDPSVGETITMAPLVVHGKVLVGNAGSELGVRGWLTALDAATGATLWRAWATGPDSDVLIGPDFKPFYADDRGVDLGVKSWPVDGWRRGGGTAWGWISYDAQLDLIFYGTANPAPWNAEQRPGDNKWTAGIFARNPATGAARWFYQYAAHDRHDYNGTNENVLLDLQIAGRQRAVLVHPDRDGYVYVIDRATGEVISATPFVRVTTSTGVDLQTGRLKMNPDYEPKGGQPVRDVCPASPGGKDWQPSAWSPRTQLLYMPHQNLCQDMTAFEASYLSGTPYLGAEVHMFAGPGGHRGVFGAWDPVKAKMAWKIDERFPVWSGAVATAGDLVFYGTMDGWFKAVDARDGKLLWQYKVDSGIVGQPISYQGPDGKQYVAVVSGVGGWAGTVVSKNLDIRDRTAAKGFAGAMADLPDYTQKGGTLYVFALP